MQKRFCDCGQSVWVEYVCIRRSWQVRVQHPQAATRLLPLTPRCSGCGQPLHIDRLH